MPTRRKVCLSVADIERIYCTANKDEYGIVYNGLVAQASGKTVSLLERQRDASLMRFIGQEIATHLGRKLHE